MANENFTWGFSPHPRRAEAPRPGRRSEPVGNTQLGEERGGSIDRHTSPDAFPPTVHGLIIARINSIPKNALCRARSENAFGVNHSWKPAAVKETVAFSRFPSVFLNRPSGKRACVPRNVPRWLCPNK
jgi:hypothetical protein